jgi:ribose/xylose/arabinose/galactoside ABC-type transport system permease subunit
MARTLPLSSAEPLKTSMTTSNVRSTLARIASSAQVAIALIALMALGSFLSPDFLTTTNLQNLLNQTSIIGVLALAQFFVVLVGGFDLSVAAILALSSVIVAVLAPRYGFFAASLAAAAAGLALGAVSGLASTVGRVPPMIATLGVSGIARGLAFVVTLKSILLPAALTAGLQITLGVFTTTTLAWLALTAILAAGLALTRVGRHVYAIGGNDRAALLAGIPVVRLKIGVYALAGLLSALGGVLFVIRSSSGVPHVGAGWELETIAGIVIGGTQLNGGEGNIVKAMVGMLIYQMISNLMNLVALNPYYQDIVKAAVIVVVVGVSVLRNQRKERRS